MLITSHSPPTYKWNTTFYGEVELQKDNKEFELWSSNFKVHYSWTPPKLLKKTRTEKRSTIEGLIATLVAYKLQWNFETQVGEEGGL
jgi:hypothetical protein